MHNPETGALLLKITKTNRGHSKTTCAVSGYMIASSRFLILYRIIHKVCLWDKQIANTFLKQKHYEI